MDTRSQQYAQRLSYLIQQETVSVRGERDTVKFHRFHDCLRELYPHLFRVCTFEDFDGSMLLRWVGTDPEREPILLMNHQDVVEAPGEWKYPPFSGAIAEDRVWGRGTLDTKGGLWAMLQAAEELAAEGFAPCRDVYFLSTCTEETDGADGDRISRTLAERGLHFFMVLDEGGMILHEPIGGAKGTFAMVGVGEKGSAVLKFIARSSGGHASTPGRNTSLVRLGKFMATVEKKNLFRAKLSDTVCAMFSCLATSMSGPMKGLLGHPRLFRPLLVKVMPLVSNAANAMLRTTIAFTMSHGSEGPNVLPQEAWVIGNMRYSHHQGGADSIRAVAALAEKFGIETQVVDPGVDSPLSDHRSAAFALVEQAVSHVFPEVKTSPYVMNAASDSRFLSHVSENCLRFAPFIIDNQQLGSVHGIDENVDVSALAPAVDFYRYIIQNA